MLKKKDCVDASKRRKMKENHFNQKTFKEASGGKCRPPVGVGGLVPHF